MSEKSTLQFFADLQAASSDGNELRGPNLRDRLLVEPEKTLEEYGVSDELKALILSHGANTGQVLLSVIRRELENIGEIRSLWNHSPFAIRSVRPHSFSAGEEAEVSISGPGMRATEKLIFERIGDGLVVETCDNISRLENFCRFRVVIPEKGTYVVMPVRDGNPATSDIHVTVTS